MMASETVSGYGRLTYGPSNVLDGDRATAWVEGVPGPGVGKRLVLAFDAPLRMRRVGIDVGYDRDAAIFAANNRVHHARLTLGDTVVDLALQDLRGVQYIAVDVVATQLTLESVSVYPGDKYDDTCISEVEVWGNLAPQVIP